MTLSVREQLLSEFCVVSCSLCCRDTYSWLSFSFFASSTGFGFERNWVEVWHFYRKLVWHFYWVRNWDLLDLWRLSDDLRGAFYLNVNRDLNWNLYYLWRWCGCPYFVRNRDFSVYVLKDNNAQLQKNKVCEFHRVVIYTTTPMGVLKGKTIPTDLWKYFWIINKNE